MKYSSSIDAPGPRTAGPASAGDDHDQRRDVPAFVVEERPGTRATVSRSFSPSRIATETSRRSREQRLELVGATDGDGVEAGLLELAETGSSSPVGSGDDDGGSAHRTFLPSAV